MTNQVIVLIVSFYIYCFMGWIWESIVLPLARKQTPYNRGFLNGPWIPIYGFGAMLVIVLFDIRQIKYPIHVLFLSGGVVACLLEYITSFVMEKLFCQRWWDYSQKAFNINGRVCLEGFLCFGLFSVIAVNYVQPFFTKQLLKIDENVLFIISGILGIGFIIDTIMSTHIALNMEKKLELVKQILEESEGKIIAELEKGQAKALERLEKRGLERQKQQLLLKTLLKKEKLFTYCHRRLIRAFPQIIKKKRRDDE